MTVSSTSDAPESDLQRARAESDPGGKTQDQKDDESRIGSWQAELTAARRREKDFRKDGRWLVQMYEGEMREEVPFNILYSNTETLAPALYNNTPRPEVKPRYKQSDPVPQASASLTQAYLEFFIDTGDADAPDFDSLIVNALHEALVPGRGLTRFDYDSDIEYGSDGPKKIKREYICGEHVPYDRFLHGYAKRWDDVPWIAFEHFMTIDEVKAQKDWHGDLADIPFTARTVSDDENDHVAGEGEETQLGTLKLALIYEVWDKVAKKVLFFADGAKFFLEERDDQYKLTGFYNIPKPMTFLRKINTLTPRALYSLYENQARELNNLTMRIRVIIKAIKAVGLYNPLVEGIDKVMDLEDGQLHPLEGAAGLADQGLDKAVWMWPVTDFITVLTELMQQREACKEVIYEITGMSDIIRGQGQASETATQSNIKNQWGGLRIKRFQKEVARYVKDCLRIAAELAFSKLGKEALFQATATDLPYKKDWDAAQARVKAIQTQAQTAQLAAPPQAPPQPGQPPQAPVAPPPPPPQPSPNDLLLLQKPIFETVLEGLASDMKRKYVIDIETNSTVDVEATEDKQNITEFLGAMAQLMAGLGPMVESGTLPWEAAKAMLLAISRKFRLGRELDDELAQMQKPAQQGGQAAAEMAKIQAERAQLEKDKMTFQVQQIQGKASMQQDQSKMKVASLQHTVQQTTTEAQAIIAAIQREVKDTKTKAALEKLVMQLDHAHQRLGDDSASVLQEMQHQHDMHMQEAQSFVEGVQHAQAAGAQAQAHKAETTGLKLDAKAQKLAAAKKATPTKKK